MSEPNIRRAVVTGGSRGLGLALTRELVHRGWHVVIDGRDATVLAAAVAGLGDPERVTAVAGDVADPLHRAVLVEAAGPVVDLLVNNASVLGAVPMPRLADYPLEDLEHVFAVNTVAPLRLVQLLLPALHRGGGRVVNLSSDAAVSAYPTWGGYGASKAALDLVTAVLAAEQPELRCYALDPGDMATELATAAGEDPAGRPAPETVVPAILRLVEADLPSGRYTAAEVNADGPSTDGPSADRPSTDGPSADRPSTDRPSADRVSADRPSAHGPSAAGLRADGPSAARLSATPAAADRAPVGADR